MKRYVVALMLTGLLAVPAFAQTSASGSASAGASVSTGQNDKASAAASGGASASAHSAKQNSGEAKGSGASSSSMSAGQGGSAALNAGTTLQAELTKSVDAKKAKPGDEVTAKLTQDVKADGKVVVHKGSKLIGHVTEAKARTKEDAESRLGIVFDRAVAKNGEEVSLNAMVQALAPPVRAAATGMSDDSLTAPAPGPRSSGGGGGGLVNAAGGAVSTVGSTAGAVGRTAASAGGSAAGAVSGTTGGLAGAAGSATLSSASQGVVGLQGLNLSSATSGNAQASVINSATQNVKLDSGTQMVLLVQKQ
ncbi:MAG TPA: hypothetical protein VKZ53_09460 [Candidatus Angelobacter sp.]|nr:hypothetical protein [Candidatus Angelobacter sp.]